MTSRSAGSFPGWRWISASAGTAVGRLGSWMSSPAPCAACPAAASAAAPASPHDATGDRRSRRIRRPATVRQVSSLPAARSFPCAIWRQEVRQAYRFIRDAKTPEPYASEESVTRDHRSRAPESFPPWEPGPLASSLPLRLTPASVICPLLPEDRLPSVASSQAVRLSQSGPGELPVRDADSCEVLLYRPHLPEDP